MGPLALSSLVALCFAAEVTEEVTVTATRTRSLPAASEAVPEGETSILPLALRNIPGVAVQQTTPGQGTPIIRGFVGSSVLTLVDGFRANNTIHRAAPNQYMALIDPFSVERITVTRGIGGARYGSDALGGVVHLYTRTPQFHGNDLEYSGRVTAQLATADASQVIHGDLSAGDRSFGATIGPSHAWFNDIRAGGGAGVLSPTAFAWHAVDGKVIAYGAEGSFDRVSGTRIATDESTGITRVLEPRFPTGAAADDFGGYLELGVEYSLLRMRAGGRATHYRREIPPAAAAPRGTLDDVQLSGNVEASLELSRTFTVMARGATGFRAPNVFDLAGLGPRPGNRYMIANPNLSAERAWGADGGVSFAFGPLRAQAVFFWTQIDGRIDTAPTGETTSDGRAVVASANLIEARYTGVEVEASLELGKRHEVYAIGSGMIAGERAPDGVERPADRIPPIGGTLGYRAKIDESFEAELEVRFALPQDRLGRGDLMDPRIDPEGTAAWATLDARVRYLLGQGVTLRAGVLNIFDAGYREHGSGYPAPGASLVAELDAKF